MNDSHNIFSDSYEDSFEKNFFQIFESESSNLNETFGEEQKKRCMRKVRI